MVIIERSSPPTLSGLIVVPIRLLSRAADEIFNWILKGIEALIEVERSLVYLLTAPSSELAKLSKARSRRRARKVVVQMPRAAPPRPRRAAA